MSLVKEAAPPSAMMRVTRTWVAVVAAACLLVTGLFLVTPIGIQYAPFLFIEKQPTAHAAPVIGINPRDFCPDEDCVVGCDFFVNGVFDSVQSAPVPSFSSSVLEAALSFYVYPENLLGADEASHHEDAENARDGSTLRYSDQFQEQFMALFRQMGLTAYSFIDMTSPKGYETEGVVAATPTDVFLIFKGTSSFRDLIPDLNVCCTHTYAFDSPVCVHHGFLEAYQNSRAAIWHSLKEVLSAASLPADVRVWLTGHSLGAALATLVATGLAVDGFHVAGVTTFGSPRVGDANFGKVYHSMGLDRMTFRWVHENDIVPQLPLELMGYRHVGLRYVLHQGRCQYYADDACVQPGLLPGFCVQSTVDHFMIGYVNGIKSCLQREGVLPDCAIRNLPI